MVWRYIPDRIMLFNWMVCNCRIEGIALTSVKKVGVRRNGTLNGPRKSLVASVLFPMLTSTTLSRMAEVRVTTRTFRSEYLGESSHIIVTLNSMRGWKVIRSVTQTPASARMSLWIKYGGNESHISTGRYIWIQFQYEELLLSVTWTHWTQRTNLFWFPVGSSIVRP
jgi:hypothetical protein